MLATVLAVIGCASPIIHGARLSVDTIGVLLAPGAGGAYATYALVSKGVLKIHPPDSVMAVVFRLGAGLLSLFFLLVDFCWLAEPRGLAVALHLGFVATAAAYALFGHGLSATPVATAVTLSLAEPLSWVS